MQPADPAIEEQMRVRCQQVLDAVDKLHQQIDHDGSTMFDVETGSYLAGDDRESTPYQVSHAVVATIGSSVDHLHAVRSLFSGAGVFHTYAPHSLVRTAIEAAATAWWMLEPMKRPDRIVRRMQHELQDATDGDRFATAMGATPRRTLDARRAQLLSIARRATNDPQTQLSNLYSTTVLKAAEQCSTLGVFAVNVRLTGSW